MILDIQRRIQEAGRIRIGQQVPTRNGKTRPSKLETFRLTSSDRRRIDQAAELYGGNVEAWQAPSGPQWQVVTQSQALDVIVPPSDLAFSQHYELWSAGGCQRRCDGQSEQITQGRCLCDPEHRQCSIHSRLSVMLRDLPGFGLWRIDTSGYYAAVELQGAVEVIQLAAGRGELLPARLRLEPRTVKRLVEGKPETRNFAVPVLDVDITPAQLFAGHGGGQAVEGQAPRPSLSVPTTQVEAGSGPAALPSGNAPLTPVPTAVPERPARSIADQAGPPEPQRKRANAAPEIPSSGRNRRAESERPAQVPEPRAADSEGVADMSDAIEMATKPQLTKLGAAFTDAGVSDRDVRLQIVSSLADRPVMSASELTKDEASSLIESLDDLGAEGIAAMATAPASSVADAEQPTLDGEAS